MQSSARILIVVFLVTCFAGSIRSQDSAPASRAASSERSTSLSFEQVAAKIDGFVESHWSAKQVPPAKLTDDATFLRRITLDLAGRIPTTRELDQFRGDESDDKRGKVIHRLIGGPEFPLHFGSVLAAPLSIGNRMQLVRGSCEIVDSKPADAKRK